MPIESTPLSSLHRIRSKFKIRRHSKFTTCNKKNQKQTPFKLSLFIVSLVKYVDIKIAHRKQSQKQTPYKLSSFLRIHSKVRRHKMHH
jgi:hypothetical protein